MSKNKARDKTKTQSRTYTSGMAKPSAADRAELERIGMVVSDYTVPMGQKSKPVDPTLGTRAAVNDGHVAYVTRNAAGKLVSSSAPAKAFDSLLELVESIG